jgi:hypothetical protein
MTMATRIEAAADAIGRFYQTRSAKRGKFTAIPWDQLFDWLTTTLIPLLMDCFANQSAEEVAEAVGKMGPLARARLGIAVRRRMRETFRNDQAVDYGTTDMVEAVKEYAKSLSAEDRIALVQEAVAA